MNQRFKVTVELSFHNDYTDSTIKEKISKGLILEHFHDLKFKSFERISLTKEEAIKKIVNLSWKEDDEDFKNEIAEIIGNIC